MGFLNSNKVLVSCMKSVASLTLCVASRTLPNDPLPNVGPISNELNDNFFSNAVVDVPIDNSTYRASLFIITLDCAWASMVFLFCLLLLTRAPK